MHTTARQGLLRELLARLHQRILCLLGLCGPTTVVLLRHADIDLPPASADPLLNAAGQARAGALRDLLRDAGVRAVLASTFRRTQLTAQPLAEHLGLPVEVRGATAGAVADLATEIRSEHRGRTVVVVSHSNLVPQLATALGATWSGPIAETAFDHLLWLTLPGTGPTTLHHLRYGKQP